MKAMFLAFLAIILISLGANQLLLRQGFSSQDTYSGDAVRLD
ncbi:MAG: hypothetical protein AAFY59_02230 [Pseudomonadota bacterium]